jgi:glucosamine--fructose-6-phosphate aminotransferase (isomerizing)
VALEAALKFKETSALQAEAFSGAEIKHGPMALIEEGYPLLIFATRGPAQAGLVRWRARCAAAARACCWPRRRTSPSAT